MNSENIIVIGRQFGSGGREIGRLLADYLKLPFYDKELLSEATNSGFTADILEEADERKPFFHSFFACAFGSYGQNFAISGLTPDRLYEVQSQIIKDVASRDRSCVFVGRTADYILRDNPAVTSIFIHADLEDRAQRILRRGDCDSLETAREMALKRDKLREGYYNFYTGREWGDCDNYDLSLNASKLSSKEIVNLIVQYINFKEQHTVNK
jgi:CMP/dCMP kinase